jgi:hypothetical protein
MNRRIIRWGLLGVALGLSALASGRDEEGKVDPKKVKAAQEAILELLESNNLRADAEVLAKKHDLDAVMVAVFKPRAKGGLGVGKPGTITPDHIDLKLNKMGKDLLTREELAREAPDLIKMAEVVKATAEVAAFQCPVKVKMGDKDPETWKAYCADMARFAGELSAALKEGDRQTVKAKARKLYATCTGCHSVGMGDR